MEPGHPDTLRTNSNSGDRKQHSNSIQAFTHGASRANGRTGAKGATEAETVFVAHSEG